MKPLKYLILNFILFFILIISSCKDDPCDNVNCLNEGKCIDGTCLCPEGFTGQNCGIEDLCITKDVDCLNGGTCITGLCDCPAGFLGTNCEKVDPQLIQYFLKTDYTPYDLFKLGVNVNQLYGKEYLNGIIFYLDTTNGSGLITVEDLDKRMSWGCEDVDISELQNVTECIGSCNDLWPTEYEPGARIGDGFSNTETILNDPCQGNANAANYCREIGEEWFLPSRGELTQMYNALHRSGIKPMKTEPYWSSTENGLAAWCLAMSPFNMSIENVYVNDDNKSQELNVRPVRAF